eukprot:GHRR01018698.1.p1 GENE.GHRR01018698.1~~GHRR01018698.1.p1  ORF type:complete len:215 (+),score=102.59 GHRR01018698.1:178-822(+)
MGKWVVVADIACNQFFKQFKNCLAYKDAAGFVAAVDTAHRKEPIPMSAAELEKLSWEAATERLLDVGSMQPKDWPTAAEERYTAALWRMYRSIVGFSALREALGMTSTSGTDEPLLYDLEEEDEDQQEHQQQPPAAAAETSQLSAGAAAAAHSQLAAAAPQQPFSTAIHSERKMSLEEAHAARAAEVQAELDAARSVGALSDWDLDWLQPAYNQ